jgi:hypothetical protein
LLLDGRDRAAAGTLARWRSFFLRQTDPCCLVVGNETLLISLLRVKIAASCPNMRSVCLQHGLFNAGYDGDDIEGRNSDANLVFDEQQREEMRRRLPRERIGEMDYPAQLPGQPRPALPQPRVVLVWTGEVERTRAYQFALERFALPRRTCGGVPLRSAAAPGGRSRGATTRCGRAYPV